MPFDQDYTNGDRDLCVVLNGDAQFDFVGETGDIVVTTKDRGQSILIPGDQLGRVIFALQVMAGETEDQAFFARPEEQKVLSFDDWKTLQAK